MSITGQSDNGRERPGLSGGDLDRSPAPTGERPGERGRGRAGSGGENPPVVLVLGAGLARRFGGDKLAARLPDGREVGAVTLAVATAAWPEVACVVRPGTRMAALAAAAGVRVVECPEAVDGMGHSLAAGVRATREAGGWVVMLADMPRVSSTTVRAVALALQAGERLVLPVFGGRRGHPVGLPRRWVDRLVTLEGDEGARAIVAAGAAEALRLETDDAGILADIDTPADLADDAPREDAASARWR